MSCHPPATSRVTRRQAPRGWDAAVSEAQGKDEPPDAQRQLSEAREQLAATAAVLRAISNSPTDAQSTLGIIAESAAQLLDVTDADIMLVEGDVLRCVAKHGPSP